MQNLRDPIALIGISCSFAGEINTPNEFWKLMQQSRDVGSEIPSERFNLDALRTIYKGKRELIQRGYFLSTKCLNEFDPSFFGLSDREALTIDPSHRLLLKKFVHLIEDANYSLDQIKGSRTSVFIGQFTTEHLITFFRSNIEQQENLPGANLSVYNASARLSYHFNLQGPNLSLDTACSSSLQAIQLAIESLRNHHADFAVAGGTNLNYTPETFLIGSTIGALSPDGRSRAYSADANGYAKGEGVALVLLKRLDDAIRDGDEIYCVIRDVQTTHDGNEGKLGYNVPSTEGQLRLLKQIYESNQIDPKDILYVEGHGTGTQVGDPIEANALGQFYQRSFYDSPLLIGSLKSIIGHTEATAGVASLIRVALSMKHRQLTPNMHFTQLNPSIRAEQFNLHIVQTLFDFPKNFVQMGINCFGIGGNTAHAIVSEWCPDEPERYFLNGSSNWSFLSLPPPIVEEENQEKSQYFLLKFSSHDDISLRKQLEAFSRWFSEIPEEFLRENRREFFSSLSFQLLFHRTTSFSSRLSFVFSDHIELKKQLEHFLSNNSNSIDGLVSLPNETKIHLGQNSSNICFVFSGQGPQWWKMGRNLYENEAIFRFWIEKLHREFLDVSNGEFSLIENLFRPQNAEESKINETNVAQPSILAVQIGLAAIWSSWNIRPKFIVGHSVGEIAAAFVAGQITLKEAAKIIYHRSRLQNLNTNQGGKMLALFLSENETKSFLNENENLIDIAAINSPKSVTLSGDGQALKQLDQRLKSERPEVFTSWLRIENAFHSYQMENFDIHRQLLQSLRQINSNEMNEFHDDVQNRQAQLYSTVTTQRTTRSDLTEDYWWKNVREPVLYLQTINNIAKEMTKSNEIPIFIEISPHPVLSMTFDEIFQSNRIQRIVLSSLNRQKIDEQNLISSFSQLNLIFGSNRIDLKKFFSSRTYSSLIDPMSNELKQQQIHSLIKTLPLYSFNEQIFWYEDKDSVLNRRAARNEHHPLLGYRLWANETKCPTWRKILHLNRNSSNFSFLFDHFVQGNLLFPASGFIELIVNALNQLYSHLSLQQNSIKLEQIQFLNGLYLKDDQRIQLETVVVLPLREFFIFSRKTSSNDFKRIDGISGNEIVTNFTDEQSLHNYSSKEWILHCRGFVQLEKSIVESTFNFRSILNKFVQEEFRIVENQNEIEHLYRYFSLVGLHYGENFQSISKLYRSNDEVLTEHRIPIEFNENQSDKYNFHPAILDGCFQGMISLIPGDFHQTGIPISIDQLFIPNRQTNLLSSMKDASNQFFTYNLLKPSIKGISNEETYSSDLVLFQKSNLNDESTALMIFKGFKLQVLNDYLRQKTLFERIEESSSILNRNLEKKVRSNELIDQFCSTQNWTLTQRSNESIIRSPKRWIFFADRNEKICQRIVDEFKRNSIDEQQITMIYREENIEPICQIKEILRPLISNDCSDLNIVYAWSFDLIRLDENSDGIDALKQQEKSGCTVLMSIIQTIFDCQCQTNPQIFILTFNGQNFSSNINLIQSSLIGFSRSILNEYSTDRMKLIDLQTSTNISTNLLENLIDEFFLDGEEILLDENLRRFSPRYEMISSIDDEQKSTQRTISPRENAENNPFYLQIPSSRSIDELQWNFFDRFQSPHEVELNENQIELSIEFVGLSYRDMLKVRGLHPYLHRINTSVDRDENIGLDFSGFVRRKGSNVRFNLNDRVFGMITDGGALKSHLILPDDHCCLAPENVSRESLSTLSTFVTVVYSLHHLVHLERSQTILIHAAASAVGIGFIQYAQMIGAKIFVTAGTKAKREFLREKFHLENVFNSRDLSFVDGIRRNAPNGRVDVIVNSLSNEFLVESLNLLAPLGHFIELGKRDIYQQTNISLFSLRPNCSFHVVDIVTVQQHRPELIKIILQQIRQFIEDEKLKPISPIEIFQCGEIRRAFQHYSTAQHWGKILIEINSSDRPLIVDFPRSKRNEMFSKTIFQHGSIVITGGFGGLALEMSKWLIEKHQVKKIILLVRRNVDELDRKSTQFQHWTQLKSLAERFQTEIVLIRVDVTDFHRVFDALKLVNEDQRYPIRGIIHNAVILRDSLVKNLTEEMLIDVMKVKATGAWNLHRISQQLSLNLHFFLMFSSIRNHIADLGQSNYNAGNHFLDSLAHYRWNHLKLPALSVGLPAISDVGIIKTVDVKLRRSMENQGVFLLPAKLTFEIIENLFEIQNKRIDPNFSSPVIFSVDWQKFSTNNLPKRIVEIATKYQEKFGNQFKSNEMKDERDKILVNRENLIEKLRSGVAKLFGSSSIDRIDLQRSLNEQGMDSLIAVELRSWLGREFFVNIALVDLLQGMSIERLSSVIQEKYFQEKEIRQIDSNENKKNVDEEHSMDNIAQHVVSKSKSLMTILVDSTSKKKLFCFPDIIGFSQLFVRFALKIKEIYGNDSPTIYAFRSRGFESDEKPFDSIELIAKEFIRQMKQIQPFGPFHFVGFSFGGLVTYEIIRQLIDEHSETVEKVLLLDPLSPVDRIPDQIEKIDENFFWKYQTSRFMLEYLTNPDDFNRSDHYLNDLTNLTHENLQNEIQTIIEKSFPLIQRRFSSFFISMNENEQRTIFERLFNIIQNNTKASKLYTNEKSMNRRGDFSSIRILMFTLEENSKNERKHRIWTNLFPQLQIEQIDGKHQTMLESPTLDHIFQRIKQIDFSPF